jgi:two-component system NtrC family sensor kinase
MIIGLSVTALAMLALIWVLTWRLVLRPVERLTEGAARVAAGDLTTRMPLTSNDEIGDMTRAWNAMIAELEDAQSELERWGTTLEQKVELKTRELEKAHRHLLHVEKMAAMGKMASVVAHEINNPLTGIATYARLLQRKLAQASHRNADSEGPEPGELERVLGLIEGEASRCGAIARDLLLFSRTPAARFAPQDIPPLIERCLMLLEHQAAGRAIHLESRVRNNLPLISCDGSQIQQMLLALTLNAIEATPPDGRVTISADLDDGGDQMVLRVTDTGCGIPSADLDKIFEPFFTTKADAEGVGLGLAVVYGVVKRHHGSVVVDSSPARGTEFTIRIPICQRDVPKSTSLTFGETADES